MIRTYVFLSLLLPLTAGCSVPSPSEQQREVFQQQIEGCLKAHGVPVPHRDPWTQAIQAYDCEGVRP